MSSSLKHEGERSVYTSCKCNCGGNHQCVIKAHVKDGKVVAVEPDDRFNPNVGREDEAVSEADLIKARLQRRPCTMGLAFHRYIYHPERILYPMKRAPGAKRGEGKFVRISWEEAINTVADKMKECRQKYGPLSIITQSRPDKNSERLFSLWGAGAEVWGWCSYEPQRMLAHLMAGERAWEVTQWASGSASDMLANAKCIVLWGWDLTVTHQGPAHQFAWFMKLARERGKPVIIIDPRYSAAAEVLADQWIPIKPGTDAAMFMAMAYVLFKEDLWNKEFVAKYVEPFGFETWQNYILGKTDGVPKTPEWAEIRCAVPAETIRAVAMMAGTVKPAWLCAHWSITRKSRGEVAVGAFAALQAMMGYWGTPGAGPPLIIGPARPISGNASWGPEGEYQSPRLFRRDYFSQAVLLLDKVRSGELSEKDYMRMVGWQANPALVKEFNPKLLFWGIAGGKPYSADHLVTLTDSANDQVKAMEKFEFIVSCHSIMTATTKYADVVLPSLDWMWEEKNICRASAYGGFESINYCPGVVEPPGETKSWVWIYCKLAEKLGVDPKKFFKYYTTDENWDTDWERFLKDCYSMTINYYKKRSVDIPTWDDFQEGQFINCDELDAQPFTGFDKQIKEGKPFRTESGKIEIYSKYIASGANCGMGAHCDVFGRTIDNLPGDWGDMPPSPVYRDAVRGMNNPLNKKYPLMLLTPHSRYRVHYLFWEHQWMRQLYTHRVWLNVADAGARGIKDNDMVQVYNDKGKVIMPAYVTARIMPGVIVIHQGAKFIPDEKGVDFGASPSTLLGGDLESCVTPAKATNIVQVEKYTGAIK